MMTRRNFFKYIVASGALLGTTCSIASLSTNKANQTILYSAGATQDGQYFVSAISSEGKQLFQTMLPARAHAVEIHPSKNQLIVFARRPGYFLLVLNAKTGDIIQHIDNIDKRPLYGHGVFSADGKNLYLTANDTDKKHGVIVVLDATNNYRKISEFSSGGIGPHELHFLSDSKTLVVANGGILTHPESGRTKLNLDTMSPSLTYIDTQQGIVLDDYKLNKQYHQLSIRHLDINQNDTVCFAMQHQGPRYQQFPLVGFHGGQTELQLATIPKKTLSQMKNYCGSVCVNSSGSSFAVSSPRGNLITLWNEHGEYIDSQKLKDGCGIASTTTKEGFYLSNGAGELHHYQQAETPTTLISSFKHYRWDNHLLSHQFTEERS